MESKLISGVEVKVGDRISFDNLVDNRYIYRYQGIITELNNNSISIKGTIVDGPRFIKKGSPVNQPFSDRWISDVEKVEQQNVTRNDRKELGRDTSTMEEWKGQVSETKGRIPGSNSVIDKSIDKAILTKDDR